MKTLKKILFILISTIFMISCTAADIDNFLKPETDTEKAYSPRNFVDIFERNFELKDREREINKTGARIIGTEEGKKIDEFINNKKTAEYKVYHENGKIAIAINLQKGIVKSIIYYDENGGKLWSGKGNEAIFYYKSGKKAAVYKYRNEIGKVMTSNKETFIEQIGYYEDGKKAYEIDNVSKKGKIYHKDGRLFFEHFGSLDNYKRYD